MNKLIKTIAITGAFLSLALSASAATLSPITTSLYQGANSSDVTTLQTFLVQQGYLSATPTGYFGSLTEAALVQFQAKQGIATTPAQGAGLVGPKTRAAINALLLANGYTIGASATAVAMTPTAARTTVTCPAGWTCVPPVTQATIQPALTTNCFYGTTCSTLNSDAINLAVDTTQNNIASNSSVNYYQVDLSFTGGTAGAPVTSWTLSINCPSYVTVTTTPTAFCGSPFQMAGTVASYGNVYLKQFMFQNTAASAQTVYFTLQGYDANGNLIGTSQSSVAIPSTGVVSSNNQTQLTNLTFNIAQPGTSGAGILKTTTFSGSFTLIAGADPVYVSSAGGSVLNLATNVANVTPTITSFTPANGTQSYDVIGAYYEIAPGASRTFNFNGLLTNNGSSNQSAATGVTTLYLTGDPTIMRQSPEVSGLQGLNSDFHQQVLLGTN